MDRLGWAHAHTGLVRCWAKRDRHQSGNACRRRSGNLILRRAHKQAPRASARSACRLLPAFCPSRACLAPHGSWTTRRRKTTANYSVTTTASRRGFSFSPWRCQLPLPPIPLLTPADGGHSPRCRGRLALVPPAAFHLPIAALSVGVGARAYILPRILLRHTHYTRHRIYTIPFGWQVYLPRDVSNNTLAGRRRMTFTHDSAYACATCCGYPAYFAFISCLQRSPAAPLYLPAASQHIIPFLLYTVPAQQGSTDAPLAARRLHALASPLHCINFAAHAFVRGRHNARATT